MDGVAKTKKRAVAVECKTKRFKKEFAAEVEANRRRQERMMNLAFKVVLGIEKGLGPELSQAAGHRLLFAAIGAIEVVTKELSKLVPKERPKRKNSKSGKARISGSRV